MTISHVICIYIGVCIEELDLNGGRYIYMHTGW